MNATLPVRRAAARWTFLTALFGLALCGASARAATHSPRHPLCHAVVLTSLMLLTCSSFFGFARAAGRILPGHIPAAAATARVTARLAPTQSIPLALTLPLHDQAGLDDLLTRLYTPGDALYHKFLTPGEFTKRFAPTAADYGKVITFARRNGLTVTGTHSNRMIVDVAGSSAVVEQAFGLHLLLYKSANGRVFYAPDREPTVPDALTAPITGIVGLDTAEVFHPHLQRLTQALDFAAPHVGTGPGNGLAPSDIKTAYGLSGVTQTGSGQTLGLFELDGYKASDIAKYESQFSLPAVPLTNTLIDGATGSTGSGASEVTLDIELQIALAPGATKIIVYEAPNSSTGVVDLYNKIATDNLAKEISTSWGLCELNSNTSTLNSENTAFQQMAAQGQSIFAAAGDKGAYDNGSTLSVDDPASQPYVTGIGGTSLTTNGAGGAYVSETTWNGGSVNNGAGGGGVSSVWSIPSYQSGVVSAASKGSTTMRNVPDVSLDADPNPGYVIYYTDPSHGPGFYRAGGTSCAAPLWAAFTALVNQQRVANGLSLIGFLNPSIYSIANSAMYGMDFHDIADGSTNLFYPAVTGYDDATGWGSFQGANLLNALVSTQFSPAGGWPGTVVTVTGSGFTGATNVSIGGAAASFVVNSDTQVTATVPAGATTGPIVILGPHGRSVTRTNFVIYEPVVYYFSPTSGWPGTVVTLTGIGFTGATNMTIGGVAASFTVNSDTKVTATVPAGAVTGPIVILGPNGRSATGVNFTVNSGPTITQFSPTAGWPGTVVTLTGSGFTGATNMSIGGAAASFTVNSDTKVTATVPAGATTGPIIILGPHGRSAPGASFTIYEPVVYYFAPTSGWPGTVVTLTGIGFTGATNMSIGGAAASFTVNSDTQVTATVPAGATTSPIIILGPNGRSAPGMNFTVNPGPTITQFSPTAGWPGTVVTLTGSGFTGATNMSIGGVAASFVVNSDTQVTATVPAGATTGPIVILGPHGRSAPGASFTIYEPVVYYFTPTSGSAGTVMTLTGIGFTGATNMSIGGVAASFVVNSDTQVTATVPAGAMTGPIVILGPNGRSAPGVNFVVH